MGTKLTELRSGCFHKAMDDEPMFVLLARDPSAPDLVAAWADQREREIREGKRPASDMDQVHEARTNAANMRAWRIHNDGAWRTGLFASDSAATVEDARPTTCRNRLRDEGHPYPRSGCASCGTGGMTGCPYERTKGS